MKSPVLGITWRKGMSVVKIIYGLNGYREAELGVVGRVDPKTKTVYFGEDWGVTYDENGQEKENVFPGLNAEITPCAIEKRIGRSP